VSIESKLSELQLQLPKPWALPASIKIPAPLVRVHRHRVLVSGHVPINHEGAISGPFGKVGETVSLEEAQMAARLTMLSILASLRKELGALERIVAWVRVFGLVNSAPAFVEFPSVINPASQLLQDLFGPEIGAHSRIAVGVAGLPWHVPVEIEAELEIA
jgi:enamine deaminase RidA (YjgF/YER057c/UK114 family)